MGGNVQTSSSSTSPSNPDVNPTMSMLLKGLQGAYKGGIKVFDKEMYPGVGDTTRSAWDTMLGAAGNPDYASAISGAMGEFGDIAQGKRFGMDNPGFQSLRDGVIQKVGSAYNNSGLFGSDSNYRAASEGLAGLDYSNFLNDQGRQERALSYLPQLFQAGLAPGAAMGAVGSAQDADALAQRQSENDLFRRQNDAPWDALARSSSILAGTASQGGSTTSQQVPWWAAALGGAGALGGLFG
jgi:hypothetical protein